jgi:LemA protein
MNYVLYLLIPVPAFLLIWVMTIYNRLVAYRNECKSALAQVDVQLKRRHELLPKLEAVVKGAMAHESQTLEAVTRLRGEAEAASTLGARLNAEGALGMMLGGLLVRMEAYPEIQATENALALQKEISHTEDRIAFSRTYYNDIVGNYNTLIQGFPALYLAKAGGFTVQPWFGEGKAA